MKHKLGEDVSPMLGDVLVFRGGGNIISRILIRLCNGYSHVGTILDKDIVERVGEMITGDIKFKCEHDVYIMESTTLNDQPDYITGRSYKGVKIVPYQARIDAYNGMIWIREMNVFGGVLPVTREQIADVVYSLHGRPYENRLLNLIGAVVDWVPFFGARVNKLIRGRHDEAMFCSETDITFRQDTSLMEKSDDPEEVHPGDYMRNVNFPIYSVGGIMLKHSVLRRAKRVK